MVSILGKIFDSKKISNISEILLEINEDQETFNVILNIRSKLAGYICLTPNMYIDRVHVYSEKMIRRRVKTGIKNELNLNLSQYFKLIS